MPGIRKSSQGLRNIGGLGAEYLEKLREAGIRTLEDLIERMRTPRSRKELGKVTGIERKDLREWAGQAELLTIEGIGPSYAELLRRAGADCAAELAVQEPERLRQKMVRLNDREQLVARIPSAKDINAWIKQALKMTTQIRR